VSWFYKNLLMPWDQLPRATVDKNVWVIKKAIICVHVLRWEDHAVVGVARRGIDSASLEAEEAEDKLYPCDQ
jgi:hypothetical protein